MNWWMSSTSRFVSPSRLVLRCLSATTVLIGLTSGFSACVVGGDGFESAWIEREPQAAFALEARCEVDVLGTGLVDVENDYLPHVISCENGAADYEALKAQAVAARSYLYYRLATGDGTIRDGQADQVYTCANEPTAEHFQAVAETAGEVLVYRGVEVAAFYVAGAIPSDRVSCISAPGDNDYSGTEPYVTVNWGFIEEGVQQSHLGWINDANYANRGCKSQNGAHCLAEAGWGYEDILIFYYGLDIEHVAATGSCATPTLLPHSCGIVVGDEADVTIVDDDSACFVSGCSDVTRWEQASLEDGVEVSWVSAVSADTAYCFGRWRLSFAEAGSYELDVYIPDGLAWVDMATYEIVHQGQSEIVSVSQSGEKGWVNLGTFDFGAGSFQYVELSNLSASGESVAPTPGVVFDKIRLRKPGTSAVDAGTDAVDAGTTTDEKPIDPGGSDTDEPFEDVPSAESPGCGCSFAGQGSPAQMVWLGALALFGALRRARNGKGKRRPAETK